jgi:dephospho-CoA kinase
MKLLGLTGNIACGKSTVARLLQEMGAAHIDADLLVHELYADRDFAAQVSSLLTPRFEKESGMPVPSLLRPDGSVNRAVLGALVFADQGALRILEALVHPEVAARREARLQELRERPEPPPVVVLEAVKLVESGQARGCHEVWCVVCDREVQLERLVKGRGLSAEEAEARLDAQPPFSSKMERLAGNSLALVHNNGTPEQLRAQVEAAWKRLCSKS